MSKQVAVSVKNVTKKFRIPLNASDGIKQKIINLFRGRKGYREFTPLKDISFDIEQGDFFGIVGRNGSGKSTLLKTIAGIYSPDNGGVEVNGTLVPFIELGVGFNPELTGRENVFLNGAMLGFSRLEMEAMYDDIVSFAELSEFMDEQLKNYSSGMQVRLAFSIAIRAEGSILLLDEVLAVGDEAFQRKCDNYFETLKRDKTKTVILVTHSMSNMKRYCNKAIMIHDGELMIAGDPGVVADKYHKVNFPPKNNNKKTTDGEQPELTAKITSDQILTPGDVLEAEITYKALDDKPVMAKAYLDLNGQAIIATNPKKQGWTGFVTQDIHEHAIKYSLPLKDFNKGEFKLIALLEDVESKEAVATYGFEGETIVRVEGLSSNGSAVFANQATMEVLR